MFAAVAAGGESHSFGIEACHLASSPLSICMKPPLQTLQHPAQRDAAAAQTAQQPIQDDFSDTHPSIVSLTQGNIL